MFQSLIRSITALDVARAVLLITSLIAWIVVSSVGGILLDQSYRREIGSGVPYAEKVEVVLDLLEATAVEDRPLVLEAVRADFDQITLEPGAAKPAASNFQTSKFTLSFLTASASPVDEKRGPRPREIVDAFFGNFAPTARVTSLELLLTDGTAVNFTNPEDKGNGFVAVTRLFFSFILASLIIAFSLAVVYRLGNPLRTFKEAAVRLAEDIDAPPLDETQGVAEVRAVSATLNAMQQRIKDYLAERTTMLAAISHDIRTGLFRLRMRSEKLVDPVEREKALEDADEMAAILDDMLTFARSDQNDIGFEKLSLPSLLTSICSNLSDEGKDAEFESGGRMTVMGDRTSLKRGFLNLIENGTKYGLRSRVSTGRLEGGRVRIIIDDDGPGIPEDQREAVFQPFVRLEDSRNRLTGGTGLGLAIVKKVMDRHKASISLHEAPSGGLRVMVVMDLA